MPDVVVAATPLAAPACEEIERNFGSRKSLRLKQTRKGCLRDLLGCEAKNEFTIATQEDTETQVLYAQEESNFWIRLFCNAMRPVEITIYEGGKPAKGEEKGAPTAILDMPCHWTGCCFMIPKMTVKEPVTGKSVGYSQMPFKCSFAPQYEVFDGAGNLRYRILPPLCCGDCCINCCSVGCTCKLPFNIHEASGDVWPAGQIMKEYSGLGNELLQINMFSIAFPPNIDANMKANLLGAAFLVDYTVFEKDNNN